MRDTMAGGLRYLVLAGVGAVVLTLAVLQLDETVVIAGLLMLAPIALLALLRRRLNPLYISPISIIAMVWAVVGALGYTFRDQVADAGGASIRITLTDEVALQTLTLTTACSLIVLTAGSLFVAARANSVRGIEDRPTNLTWSVKPPRVWLVAAAAIPLIGYMIDVPIADFFERNYYLLGERGSFFAAIFTQLATLAVVLLGYTFSAGSKGVRFASLILLSAYIFLLGSFGSRRFALIPILFALGAFLAANTRRTRIGLVVGGLISAAMLPLPLEFRSNASHGIIPYLETLRNLRWEDADWLGAVNNVLVAFPIIGESAFGNRPVYVTDLLTALNPISGNDAGWYEIYYRLRLNHYTPMAGIGEVGNVGWIAVILVFTMIGIGAGWLEIAVRTQAIRGNTVYIGMLIGLTALFSLQMIQYNLRQASRLLLYALLLELGRRFLTLFRLHREARATRRRGARASV